MAKAPPAGHGAGTRDRKALRMYLGLFLSVGCLAWVLRSVNMEDLLAAFREANWFYIFVAVIGTSLSYVLRSLRWPFLFEKNPLRFWDSYRCLILGFFMNNVLPARIGEFVRAHLGAKATSHSRTEVLATIASERLVDGLTISFLFVSLFTFGSHRAEALEDGAGTAHYARIVYHVALLFGVAGLSTVLVVLLRNPVFRVLERAARVMPGHVTSYSMAKLRKFVDGLVPLVQPSRFLIAGCFSLAVWSVELGVFSSVASAFNRSLSWAEASYFLAAVNFSSLIPAGPGGVGVIEAFAGAALSALGEQREIAFAMVATQHLIQILVVGVPGALFFFLQLGGRVPEEGEVADEEPIVPSVPYTDVSEPRPAHHESAPAILSAEAASSLGVEPVDLTIVIPAYNEETRLPKTLLTITEYLDRRALSYEVLVVDDGSIDETPVVVRQMEHLSPRIRLLSYPFNRGKGYAVRFGVYNSRGKRVLFCDADGATPIEELERLERALDDGADLAIGSRALYSSETGVETVWYRKTLGRIFNGVVNLLVLPGIADTQCGFKLFRSAAAHEVFRLQHLEGFSFDVEILFLARREGYRIAEVPINWRNIPGSKVRLGRDSIRMFRDVLIVRLRDLFGGYTTAR